MLTENDLRAVLNEWADTAVEAAVGAEIPEERTQKKQRRWLAPLAAAAAVAAAAIAITVVTDRDPVRNTVAAPAPSHSVTGRQAIEPNLSSFTPKWMVDNLRRFLPHGTISHVTGSSSPDAATIAFDYDDGHGETYVRLLASRPVVATLATTGGGCAAYKVETSTKTVQCTLGQLAGTTRRCPESTHRGTFDCTGFARGKIYEQGGAHNRIIGQRSARDIVLQLELHNAVPKPTDAPDAPSHLLTEAQMSAIVADKSWSERAR